MPPLLALLPPARRSPVGNAEGSLCSRAWARRWPGFEQGLLPTAALLSKGVSLASVSSAWQGRKAGLLGQGGGESMAVMPEPGTAAHPLADGRGAPRNLRPAFLAEGRAEPGGQGAGPGRSPPLSLAGKRSLRLALLSGLLGPRSRSGPPSAIPKPKTFPPFRLRCQPPGGLWRPPEIIRVCRLQRPQFPWRRETDRCSAPSFMLAWPRSDAALSSRPSSKAGTLLCRG